MRTKIKPFVKNGRFDSSSMNSNMDGLTNDMAALYIDLHKSLVKSKTMFDTNTINTLSIFSQINDIEQSLLESSLKPRYSIITPFITRNAPMIGGNSYNLIDLNSAIVPSFGIITEATMSSNTKLPNITSSDISLEYDNVDGLVLGDPSFMVRQNGWIASMDSDNRTDVTLTININTQDVTNLLANTIDVTPIGSINISRISIVTAGGDEITIVKNINQATRIPFNETNIVGAKIYLDSQDYLLYNESAYTGVLNFDIKRINYAPIAIFNIEFQDPTSIVDVDFYLQDIDSEYELIERIATDDENISWEFAGNTIMCRMGQVSSELIPRLIRYIKVKR